MSDLHTLNLRSGRKLAYAQYGDPGGRPLFYFHGWPSSRLQGALLHEVGRVRGLCVIAPDRPGIGESDPHPERTLLDWPPVVEELADQLGYDRFYVLGVSGGGPYVMASSYALPDRIISAGVICGAPPLCEVGTAGMMWPYRTALLIRKYAPVLLDQGLKLADVISHQPHDGPIMRRLLASLGEQDRRAMTVALNYEVITGSFHEAMRSGVAALRVDGDLYSAPWGFDVTAMKKIPQFWHGGLDKNIPLSLVERYINRIPNAKLVVHPEDGHYSLPILHAAAITDAMLAEAA